MQAPTMTPTRPGWPHSWRRRALATTALISASLMAHTALAQATWTGAVSSDFDTAGNWSEGVVPDSTSLSFGPTLGQTTVTLERPNETSPYLISGGLTFEDAAQSYLLDVKEGAYLGILGPVTNSSGVTQQFNVSGGAGGVISFIELQGETGSNVIYTAGENGRVRLRTSVPENSASFVLDGGRLEYSGSGVLELGSLTGTGTLAYELNGAETGTIRLGGFGTSDTVEVLGATIAQVGALTLEKVGAGTLIMTGSNGYSGGTRILGGTLQFGQGSFDSPLVGNVYTGDSEDSGRLAFGYEGDTSYSGVISGAGDLAILDGAVTLSGMNTFTGLTSISEGATLALTGQGRVNQSSGVEVNGAFNVSGASSAAAKSISGSGIINVGGASLSLTDSTGSFAGNVTGTGGLSIDAGSLTLTGASDLTGQFGVGAAASLTVGDGETSGWISANVLNYGALTFDRSDGGTYSGRISGTGDITLTGGGSYILTGENSNSGSVTITEGTSVQLGDGGATGRLGGSGPNSGSIANDGTLIYNRSSATTYAGVISGEGNLRQIGSGRLTLNGVNSYSGGTSVEAGELLIGGSETFAAATVGGDVSVANGAVLGGFGTIDGSLSILDGGSLRAGSSTTIGALGVNGNLEFSGDSLFNVRVNGETGASDHVSVGGTALLAGSVAHIGFAGIYDPVSTYTILTAESLSGEFNGVTSDFAFLYPVLDYSETEVTLSLARNDIELTGVTQTPNQFAVAKALGALGPQSPIYTAVLPLGEAEANAAFDSLSGEAHASTGSFLIGNSALLRDALGQRMRRTEAQGAGGVTVSSKGAATTPVWASSFGSWSEIDGSSNVEGLSGSAGGLMAGVDRQLDSGWLIGAALGLGRSSFDLDDGSASVDSNDWHLGLYADRSWGRLAFRGGLGFTSHDVSSEREVAVGLISERQEADYDARSLQAFGELGYRIDRGRAVFEPFVNLAHVRFSSDDIDETGGTAALEISRESRSTTFATLGLRGAHGFSLQGAPARLEGAVAWRRAFGDLNAASDNSFIAGGGFTVAGVDLPRDVVTLEAGLGLSLGAGRDFSIGYAGQFGDGVREDGLRATLKMRF